MDAIGRVRLIHFVEIVRQICWVEFTFDYAVAAKEASMSNVVPFRDQMRGDQHRLSALGFEAKCLLQPFSPAGIETKAWFVEQKNRSVRQKQQSDAEPLARPAGKLFRANSRDIAQSG